MPLRVGQDIDAWCTKCRLDTTHVIVAMGPDGVKPKRVECTSCNGQHNYRPPKTAKPQRGAGTSERVIAAAAAQKAMAEATATAKPAGSKPVAPPPAEPRLPPTRPARATRTRAAAKPRASKAAESSNVSASGGSKRNEWSRKIEEADLTQARKYSMRLTFEVDDLVEHPSFGLGIVIDIVDSSKCGILFESGRRVLAMGHAPAS